MFKRPQQGPQRIQAYCDTCGHDLLVAFSCKGRGLCPSCTTRRMAETAAHLVEHVLPQVPVRQWVVTFPRRLRFFLHRDSVLLGRVRRSVLRARVTACAGQPVAESAPVTVPAADSVRPAPTRRRASIHWARLLARIYETRPLCCPRCHGEMRLIASRLGGMP